MEQRKVRQIGPGVLPRNSGIFPAITPQVLAKLDRDLRAANERVQTFRETITRDSAGGMTAELGGRALQEIDVAHEELRVVEEELHAQADEIAEVRETLDAERRRYTELFEAAPEAYIVTDVLGCVLGANRRAGTLFNLDAIFLSGKPLVMFVAPADRQRFRDLLDVTRLSRVEAELRVQPRKGEPSIWVALTAEPTVAAGGQAAAVRWLVRDIHAQKGAAERQAAVELELRERVRELEQTRTLLERLLEREQDGHSRMADLVRQKERMLSEVAHELRSPLASIAGWLRVMTQGEPERGTRIRALVSMTRGVRALARLVEDLVDHARFEAHTARLVLSPTNLVNVIIDVIEDLRPLADLKSVAIGLTTHPYRIDIEGDAARLDQVFRNLIGNAIKFTPENGVININVRVHQFEAIVAITDNGVGIARESLASIFKPFTQLVSTGSRAVGLGLGLSIAHRFVELHGGTITAESEGANSGSTFRVTLPLAPAN